MKKEQIDIGDKVFFFNRKKEFSGIVYQVINTGNNVFYNILYNFDFYAKLILLPQNRVYKRKN